MTDLTAAQIVARLSNIGMGNADLIAGEAATLIEQQAEQIARLNSDSADWQSIALENQGRWHAAESEVAALRKVIEDAPHEGWCEWPYEVDASDAFGRRCTCWKSKALTTQITT